MWSGVWFNSASINSRSSARETTSICLLGPIVTSPILYQNDATCKCVARLDLVCRPDYAYHVDREDCHTPSRRDDVRRLRQRGAEGARRSARRPIRNGQFHF